MAIISHNRPRFSPYLTWVVLVARLIHSVTIIALMWSFGYLEFLFDGSQHPIAGQVEQSVWLMILFIAVFLPLVPATPLGELLCLNSPWWCFVHETLYGFSLYGRLLWLYLETVIYFPVTIYDYCRRRQLHPFLPKRRYEEILGIVLR